MFLFQLRILTLFIGSMCVDVFFFVLVRVTLTTFAVCWLLFEDGLGKTNEDVSPNGEPPEIVFFQKHLNYVPSASSCIPGFAMLHRKMRGFENRRMLHGD